MNDIGTRRRPHAHATAHANAHAHRRLWRSIGGGALALSLGVAGLVAPGASTASAASAAQAATSPTKPAPAAPAKASSEAPPAPPDYGTVQAPARTADGKVKVVHPNAVVNASATPSSVLSILTRRWAAPRAVLAKLAGVRVETIRVALNQANADLANMRHEIVRGAITVTSAEQLAGLAGRPAPS